MGSQIAREHYDSLRYSLLPLCILLVLTFLIVSTSYLSARSALLAGFLLLASFIFVVMIRQRQAVADRLYPVVLSAMALSLLLGGAVVSNNLSGWDIHDEYYLFLQVFYGGAWHAEIPDMYNSALSVTILPSFIANMSSLDGISIFKFVFPILFSIVPVLLYRIYRSILPAEGAFLSVLVFVFYPGTYGEITQVARQMIAEILLVLCVLLFLSTNKEQQRSGRVVLILLSVGIVIAHYSLGLIYILLMASYFIMAPLISQRFERSSEIVILTLTTVVAFSWYAFSAGASVVLTLTSFLSFAFKSLFTDLLNPASRPLIVQQALGMGTVQLGLLHILSRLTQYAVVLCVILGFLTYVCMRKKSVTERRIIPFMTGSFLFVLSAIMLPFFSNALNFSRFYQIALMFVSPCFYIGAEKLRESLASISNYFVHSLRARTRLGTRSLLPAVLLLSYLLFTSGWVWAVSMDSPTSYVFDWRRMANSTDVSLKIQYFATYTVAEDAAAASWLRSYVSNSRKVCSDYLSRDHTLNSYGERARGGPLLPYECDFSNEYVFLGELNAVYDIGTEAPGNQLVGWPISNVSSAVGSMNRMYSGSAVIYTIVIN